ncbi:MAG: hypothetical protein LBK82_06630, partial [Planctomycetaceae bacterium]|nr:hypothetical protein [Planctomycetaceae bacterium]
FRNTKLILNKTYSETKNVTIGCQIENFRSFEMRNVLSLPVCFACIFVFSALVKADFVTTIYNVTTTNAEVDLDQ